MLAKPVGVGAGSHLLIPTGRTIWIADAHRDDGKRCVVQADEKLTAFLELEGGDSVFVGGLKIDHPWPQCDAHGLMMKLEIRSTGNSGFGD